MILTLFANAFLFKSQFAIVPNGLAFGAVADFGALNCQYTTNVDAR
jgi:hypothetical protein